MSERSSLIKTLEVGARVGALVVALNAPRVAESAKNCQGTLIFDNPRESARVDIIGADQRVLRTVTIKTGEDQNLSVQHPCNGIYQGHDAIDLGLLVTRAGSSETVRAIIPDGGRSRVFIAGGEGAISKGVREFREARKVTPVADAGNVIKVEDVRVIKTGPVSADYEDFSKIFRLPIVVGGWLVRNVEESWNQGKPNENLILTAFWLPVGLFIARRVLGMFRGGAH